MLVMKVSRFAKTCRANIPYSFRSNSISSESPRGLPLHLNGIDRRGEHSCVPALAHRLQWQSLTGRPSGPVGSQPAAAAMAALQGGCCLHGICRTLALPCMLTQRVIPWELWVTHTCEVEAAGCPRSSNNDDEPRRPIKISYHRSKLQQVHV